MPKQEIEVSLGNYVWGSLAKHGSTIDALVNYSSLGQTSPVSPSVSNGISLLIDDCVKK